MTPSPLSANGSGRILIFGSGCRRPGEVLVQELEGADAVDGVRAVEPLDLRTLADAELVVAALHLGVFVADPFIQADSVVVTALDHEGGVVR